MTGYMTRHHITGHDVTWHDITLQDILLLKEEESPLSREVLKKILFMLCRYMDHFRSEDNSLQEIREWQGVHGGGRGDRGWVEGRCETHRLPLKQDDKLA
jgi:hypothetical protein